MRKLTLKSRKSRQKMVNCEKRNKLFLSNSVEAPNYLLGERDDSKMNKKELILASLAASHGNYCTPVQIQKLVFLFQEYSGLQESEKPFKFQPLDYGPFDKTIYFFLEEMSDEGLIEIIGEPFGKKRFYRVSHEGLEEANKQLDTLETEKKVLLKKLAHLVKSLSFAQLVGAVYKAFPAWKVNSVFRGE